MRSIREFFKGKKEKKRPGKNRLSVSEAQKKIKERKNKKQQMLDDIFK